MTMYVYMITRDNGVSWDDVDFSEDCEIVAIVTGENNEECEAKASDAGYDDTDCYGWTYSADEIPMADHVAEI